MYLLIMLSCDCRKDTLSLRRLSKRRQKDKKKHFLVLCCVVLHAYQNKYGHRMWHNVGTSECLNMPLEKAETDGIETWKLFGHCLAQSFHAPFRVLLKQKNTKTQPKKKTKKTIPKQKKHKGLQAPIDKLLNSLATLRKAARRNLRLALRVAYALHPAPTGNYTT